MQQAASNTLQTCVAHPCAVVALLLLLLLQAAGCQVQER
jgi:hypothetical protein